MLVKNLFITIVIIYVIVANCTLHCSTVHTTLFQKITGNERKDFWQNVRIQMSVVTDRVM